MAPQVAAVVARATESAAAPPRLELQVMLGLGQVGVDAAAREQINIDANEWTPARDARR